MDLPIVKWIKDDASEEVISAASYVLRQGAKFKGVSYLYTITLTPEVFDPNDIHKPVKDRCSITPTMYDPNTFTAYKKIILDLQQTDIEATQDGKKNYRKDLHDRLDDILDNQREYTVKGKKSIMLRGKFPMMEMLDNINNQNEFI